MAESRHSHDPETKPARPAPEHTAPAFPEILTELWQRNYTGRVVLHFLRGAPKIIEYQGRKRPISG